MRFGIILMILCIRGAVAFGDFHGFVQRLESACAAPSYGRPADAIVDGDVQRVGETVETIRKAKRGLR